MLIERAVLQGAFDAMAMGNYPFASSYMGGALPPWPMRAACNILADNSPSDGELLRVRPSCHLIVQWCFIMAVTASVELTFPLSRARQ